MLRLGEKIPNRGSIQADINSIDYNNLIILLSTSNGNEHFYGKGVPEIDQNYSNADRQVINITRLSKTNFLANIKILIHSMPLQVSNPFSNPNRDATISVSIDLLSILFNSVGKKKLIELGLDNTKIKMLAKFIYGTCCGEFGFRYWPNGDLEGFEDVCVLSFSSSNLKYLDDNYTYTSGIEFTNGSREVYNPYYPNETTLALKYINFDISINFEVTEASLLAEKKPKVNSAYFSIFSQNSSSIFAQVA